MIFTAASAFPLDCWCPGDLVICLKPQSLLNWTNRTRWIGFHCLSGHGLAYHNVQTSSCKPLWLCWILGLTELCTQRGLTDNWLGWDSPLFCKSRCQVRLCSISFLEYHGYLAFLCFAWGHLEHRWHVSVCVQMSFAMSSQKIAALALLTVAAVPCWREWSFLRISGLLAVGATSRYPQCTIPYMIASSST